jgi:biopolymer transport protein ExbD
LSRRRLQPDLDLTPLIDVLFMLILFFVLTASLLQGQIEVRLPAGHGTALGGRPAVIEILADGRFRYEGKSVSREEAVASSRQDVTAGRSLVVAADRSVPYGTVASFLETLRAAGVQDVGLALDGGKSP